MSITVGTDSYISLTDANTYMSARLYTSSWDDASVADQEAALKMATRAVDRLPLRGVKKATTQTLQFPRCYRDRSLVPPSEDLFEEDYYRGWWCESSTPQPVLDAVCEEALFLLTVDPASKAKREAAGLQSVRVGEISETYRSGETVSSAASSSEARELLRPYIAGAVAIT